MGQREKSGGAIRVLAIVVVVAAIAAVAFVSSHRFVGTAAIEGSGAGPRTADVEKLGGRDGAPVGFEAGSDAHGLAELEAVLPGEGETVERVEMERPDGSSVVAELTGRGRVPESLPADVPVYPGAESVGGLGVSGEGTAIALTTSRRGSDVFAYYMSELRVRGWMTDAALAAQSNGDRIAAVKGDRSLWVTILPVGGGAQIFLATQEGGA